MNVIKRQSAVRAPIEVEIFHIIYKIDYGILILCE